MADNFDKPHIGRIEEYASGQQYKYPAKIKVDFPTSQRNRSEHGNRILRKLQAVRQQLQLAEDTELPENIIRDDAIYVTFISEWGYPLKFDQLHQNTDRPTYQIVNIKQEQHPEQENQYRYHVALMLTKRGISHFIKRVEEYLNPEKDTKSGAPKANQLIANIANIKLATLEAFWSDGPEISFPSENEIVWWEVWFRKTDNDGDRINKVITNLEQSEAQIGQLQLDFPEHFVRLVRASANQLSNSLMLLDNLAELRHPQELSDFITHDDISIAEKELWLQDLVERTENRFDENSVLVCLLDSGVSNQHPLINPLLPDERLYTWIEDWGKFDSIPGGGHGTGMAGLVLYGDLTQALADNGTTQLYHGLESFKIYHPQSPNDPEMYGAIYEYACATPIVDNPNHPRIFCLSVTNKDFGFRGRPSSSSTSVDKIAFGSILDPNEPQLILVSGGNVRIESAEDFPDKNFYESVQDPGQAYNALTVGSYTRKDRINAQQWPGWNPLAVNGEMAPSNSTSGTWETQWPNKPDIVMEGGNLAHRENVVDHKDTLQLLTTHKDHRINIFQTFGDTSASVSLASKMAAELKTEYPDYWPETIRGLMVHSAEWTDAMLQSRNLNLETDRRALLRSVGYGVPILEQAKNSANNSLTLVSQRSIQPYRLEKSQPRYNEYHLYELPWPVDVLRDEIGDRDATIKVTLSYYIEPNPGNRQYASNFRYHSHELDFKLIKPLEQLNEFKRRISAASSGTEEHDDDTINRSSEPWTLKERVRSKGSIKKDFITISGVEMSRRNILAVYPKNGWYRTRKQLGKIESMVRYSLIITIETPEQEVDLYTPVFNIVQTVVPIGLT
ncbi:S8 family peptidase [uncultured Imperialibacter sp.]|uniref:S8 family peptidase n=1 Tax=uncultured Imperialibacter sp. TaxID=1672639 RepID=UPI0030D9DE29|tara:strand:+ start:132512 stop:135043 length:2532 start_codon:yes stop_codon:yes gene_type:complete